MDTLALDRLSGDPVGQARSRPARGRLGGALPATATGLVLRELTSLALVTQAVWILASPDLWPTRLAPPVASAAVFLSVAAWILLLLLQYGGSAGQRRFARYADVAAVALAAAVCGVTADASGSGEQAASLAVLCAGLIGALAELRVAVVLVAGLGLLTLEPLLRYGQSTPEGGAGPLVVTAYVVIIGGCIIGVRGVLERNARRIDNDAARRGEIERQQRLVEGVESAMRRQERLLHETVLNTLTAIHRGGLGSTPAMGVTLEERCLEAIEVLSDLESGAQSLEPPMIVSPLGYVSLTAELTAFIDGLRADGLRVEVVVDSLEDVPPRVRGAVLTATREALANVARHARAHRAWVLVRVRPGGSGVVSVRVEVRDDGVGFDPRSAPRGFGVNRAIVGPMQEAGGSGRVESRPGDGTRVILEWTGRPADGAWGRRSRTPGFVLPAAATFGLFLAATATLAWLQFDHPPVTVTDIALVAVLGVLISMATAEAPLSWGLIVTISALGPLFALLRASVGESPDPAFGGGWALSAIAALFMTAAAIGPRWSWLPLLVSWLMVEGDPVGTVLQPATVVVVVGALMGRGLRRDALAVERVSLQRQSAQTALDVTREGLARLRARYGPLEDSEAIAVLQGIVDGRLDPEDADVRRRAGLEETFIRNLVRIDPEADRLRGLAARLSRVAHRCGVHLRVDLSLPRLPAVVVGPGIEESFVRAVESTVPDDSARLTARTEGDQVVVTLLTPILDGERDHMRALPLAGVDTDPDDPDDHVMLWEARLAYERRS